MLERETCGSHAQASLRPGGGAIDESTPRSPRHNHLLAQLPREHYERLRPRLEPCILPLGFTLHGAGDRDDFLYFLTAGIVSRFYVTRSGDSAQFAVTGSEGVIGVASFLGGVSTPGQAAVVIPGHAYRLRADHVKVEFEHGRALPSLLLRYTQGLIAQVGQTAVCNRHHSLEQQLCRWLLSIVDRLPSDEIAMTQELIGHMLGVRRESVTEAAGKLQRSGLIHYARGHIAVVDRAGLELRACECYSVVKGEFERLLPEHEQAG